MDVALPLCRPIEVRRDVFDLYIKKVAHEDGVRFRGLKKSTGGNEESEYNGHFIRSESEASKVARAGPGVGLLAGTAWLFAVIVPVMLIPTLVGARLYRNFTDTGFRRIVLGLLGLSGAILVATTLPAFLR